MYIAKGTMEKWDITCWMKCLLKGHSSEASAQNYETLEPCNLHRFKNDTLCFHVGVDVYTYIHMHTIILKWEEYGRDTRSQFFWWGISDISSLSIYSVLQDDPLSVYNIFLNLLSGKLAYI